MGATINCHFTNSPSYNLLSKINCAPLHHSTEFNSAFLSAILGISINFHFAISPPLLLCVQHTEQPFSLHGINKIPHCIIRAAYRLHSRSGASGSPCPHTCRHSSASTPQYLIQRNCRHYRPAIPAAAMAITFVCAFINTSSNFQKRYQAHKSGVSKLIEIRH